MFSYFLCFSIVNPLEMQAVIAIKPDYSLKSRTSSQPQHPQAQHPQLQLILWGTTNSSKPLNKPLVRGREKDLN